MSLFLLTFLLLYGGMHLYGYRRLTGAFDFSMPVAACIIFFMAVMVCAPILVRLAERSGLDEVAVPLAYAGYTWMGLLFLFCVTSVTIDAGRLLMRLAETLWGRDVLHLLPNSRQAFVAAALVSFSVAVYGYFEARSIRTQRVTLATKKLPPSIARFTIVQISDVHLGLIVGAERLRRIVEIISAAHPDMLVSTGDLVDGQINSLGDLAGELRSLEPRYGKFAVTGNHEYYAGIDHAMAFTRQSGFKIIHNGRIDAGGVLTVAGVDDPAGQAFGSREVAETEVLENAPQGRFVLLLKHRPVVARESLGLFDLQLSGHVHKGQIFPFGMVTRLFYPVGTGLLSLGENAALYVSRGTGTWGPPLRVLAPPEVTIIELVNAGKE